MGGTNLRGGSGKPGRNPENPNDRDPSTKFASWGTSLQQEARPTGQECDQETKIEPRRGIKISDTIVKEHRGPQLEN